MSRSMQIVVGGEGEEPSYLIKHLSVQLAGPAARTQKHALTQCALLRYRNAWIVWTADLLGSLE